MTPSTAPLVVDPPYIRLSVVERIEPWLNTTPGTFALSQFGRALAGG